MMRRVVAILVAIGQQKSDVAVPKQCIEAHDKDEDCKEKIQVRNSLLQTAPAKAKSKIDFIFIRSSFKENDDTKVEKSTNVKFYIQQSDGIKGLNGIE